MCYLLCSIYYIEYSIYCILYTIYYILYSIYIYYNYTIYIIDYILYIYGVSVDITRRVYVKMYLLTQVEYMDKN